MSLNSPLSYTHTKLHVGGAEDLERLKLEEAAIQRRLRLSGGGGDRGGQRLGEGEGRRTLEGVQQQKKELGGQ